MNLTEKLTKLGIETHGETYIQHPLNTTNEEWLVIDLVQKPISIIISGEFNNYLEYSCKNEDELVVLISDLLLNPPKNKSFKVTMKEFTIDAYDRESAKRMLEEYSDYDHIVLEIE